VNQKNFRSYKFFFFSYFVRFNSESDKLLFEFSLSHKIVNPFNVFKMICLRLIKKLNREQFKNRMAIFQEKLAFLNISSYEDFRPTDVLIKFLKEILILFSLRKDGLFESISFVQKKLVEIHPNPLGISFEILNFI